jgi:hypothetical protein
MAARTISFILFYSQFRGVALLSELLALEPNVRSPIKICFKALLNFINNRKMFACIFHHSFYSCADYYIKRAEQIHAAAAAAAKKPASQTKSFFSRQLKVSKTFLFPPTARSGTAMCIYVKRPGGCRRKRTRGAYVS